MTRAQNDILWEEYWNENDKSGTTVAAGGTPTLNPNDLFLMFSDMGASCDSPTVNVPCGNHYRVTIVLPPALQAVGVYDLKSPEITFYSSTWETGPLDSTGPDGCSQGGGSILGGTLEILSIDASEVHFKVELDPFWDTNPDGEYTALRCP